MTNVDCKKCRKTILKGSLVSGAVVIECRNCGCVQTVSNPSDSSAIKIGDAIPSKPMLLKKSSV